MAAKVYAKYPVEPEGRDVHGRFSALYNSASKGKGHLLSQCVAGGTLLRECGLLELAISICESEAYINAATPSQRRAFLLGELGLLTGTVNAAPAAPVATSSLIREPVAPTGTSEAAGEQPAAPDEPDDSNGAPGEQPAPQNKRPQVRVQGVELPNLGASTSKK